MAAGSRPTLAVIGAGVAGCALVAQLRRLGWTRPISLWETGRGPGGRAGTRRSRQDPALAIDHGSPLLNILAPTTHPPPALLTPLLEKGWLEPWQGVIAGFDAQGDLRMDPSNRFTEGLLLRGRGGMDQLCAGLLSLAGEGVDRHFNTLVRHLVPAPRGGWTLMDRNGTVVAEVDWLVLASTLPAHPRSLRTFGWQAVPLREAADRLQDPQLDHGLAVISAFRSEARSNLLLVCSDEGSRAWRRLPFRLLELDPQAQQRWGLSRVAIQPLDDGRCAVVTHSTSVFAEEHLEVFGSGSAVALQLGRSAPPWQEARVIAALGEALMAALGSRIDAAGLEHCDQRLMRWGAAFPEAPGLPGELMLCPASRVGFCGDFISGPGFGRIEGALRSAERLAPLLMEGMEKELG